MLVLVLLWPRVDSDGSIGCFLFRQQTSSDANCPACLISRPSRIHRPQLWGRPRLCPCSFCRTNVAHQHLIYSFQDLIGELCNWHAKLLPIIETTLEICKISLVDVLRSVVMLLTSHFWRKDTNSARMLQRIYKPFHRRRSSDGSRPHA